MNYEEARGGIYEKKILGIWEPVSLLFMFLYERFGFSGTKPE